MVASSTSFQAPVGADFVATLVNPPALTSPLGARMEVPVTGAIVSYWRTATLDPNTGVWSVTLDAPNLLGSFLLVWRTNEADPPQFSVDVPIDVVRELTVLTDPVWPVLDPDDVRPSVDEVAKRARTRTYDKGGNDVATFQNPPNETRPTLDEAEQQIDQALDDIVGQLPTEFDARHYSQVQRLITLQAVLNIEISYYREQADDAAVRMMRDAIIAGLKALQTRIQADFDQSSLMGGMEPWANRTISGGQWPRMISPVTVGPVDASLMP